MKRCAKMLPLFFCLLSPFVCNAQRLAQVACAKQDGYLDLSSSVATMEIRTTLKCGQQVQILDRFDNFIHVLTDKGEDGFVAANSLTFLKTAAAAKSPAARAKQKQAASAAQNTSQSPAPPREIILPNQTPVHLKLGRELSSATAHLGEQVNIEDAREVSDCGLVA